MEEPSLTSTNVHVSNHIPYDIVLSILSKLPLKSFKRFACVHKSWSLLFDNSYFMTMYRNNFLLKNSSDYSEDTCLLQGLKKDEDEFYYTSWGHGDIHVLYSLSGKNFENRVKLKLPYEPFEDDEGVDWYEYEDEDYDYDEDVYGYDIIGSVSINGILCLGAYQLGDYKLIVWNTATKKFKVIPPSDVESKPHYWTVDPTHHLLGYDRIKDDYKVLRFNDYHSPLGSFWEIYSLNSNSWRKIDVDKHHFCDNDKVYMDGVSHWSVYMNYYITPTYLVSFDFINESFTTTPIPSSVYDSSSFEEDNNFDDCAHLMILNGSIAFILSYDYYNYEEASTFRISILAELGVKESWIKLFIVGHLPCFKHPIGAVKKGKILFRSKDGDQKLFWFDLCTGMTDKIDVATYDTDIWFCV